MIMFCGGNIRLLGRQKLIHSFSIKLKVFKAIQLDSKSFFCKKCEKLSCVNKVTNKGFKKLLISNKLLAFWGINIFFSRYS